MVDNVMMEELKGTRTIEYGELTGESEELVNTNVIPTRDYFQLGEHTTVRPSRLLLLCDLALTER